MKKYKIKVNGTEYEVSINSFEGNMAQLTVNDVDFDVEVEGITTNPTRMSMKPPKKLTEPQSATPVVKPQKKSTTNHLLLAPLPGVVLEIKVKEGDTIKAGQVVMILEAMKMENNITADQDGIIEKINPRIGDAVLEGDVLITIK